MKSVDLNSNWSVTVGDETVSCDLPYDATATAARDYACAFGVLNGYIPSEKAVFTRTLPQEKYGNGIIDIKITGVCGYGEVFVNDISIGLLNHGYGPYFYSAHVPGTRNTIKIVLTTSPEMSDKYLGLGIAGGVELITLESPVEHGIDYPFVKTAVVGDRVYADTEVLVFNNEDKPKKFVLDCTVLNMRGKRAGKKQRKIFLRANQHKTISVRVRINNAYEWSPSDPYMYTMSAKLTAVDGESEPCSVNTRFGIVTRSLSPTRGLYINNRKTLLMGAYLSHADVALGAASLYCNERRKIEALKAIGYNAVHFVGCPAAATLDACDDVGMFAFVDLFPYLNEAKSPLGGIFSDRYFSVYLKILELRNHPSVTVYGVADDVAECYNRYDGHILIRAIADRIREFDGTRPITVSTHEQVPTRSELEEAGCRKTVFDNDGGAINAGREKNVFENLTADAFAAVDVCGFNYLYSLYETELSKRNRLVLGTRTSNEHAFDSLDATEKNDRVIGDFNDCGMDYPGGGKLNENTTTFGDLDSIGCEKPQSVYKRILLGERGIAYIVVRDPDTDEPVHMWNWPRYLGQKVKVEVYTSGDVVALYLDGRIVGRKLAGKVNKHIASFSVDYYPGTLEAVAYFKGTECARSQLKSAGSPKTIKLTAYAKNLSVGRKDVGFVYIDVCDRDGEIVPYAMRELTVTVTGGELIGFVNADPMLRKNSFDTCPAYNGKALAVIRPDPGEEKAVVKVTGDGLLAARMSFKIKN